VENKALTRKDFILLTFTLIGSTAVAGSACDDEDDTTGAGGSGGGGTGRGGTTGTAGSGTGSGGSTGSAGTTGNAGSGGSGGLTSCPGAQLPDTIGHVHTFSVPVSAVSSTSTMMFNTGMADGHVHPVTLTGAQLMSLSSGGSVTVTSGLADGHVHMYMVTCQ
jgi:hypothetical protein